MSFINIKNNKVPRTDPRGTPHLIFFICDLEVLNVTN